MLSQDQLTLLTEAADGELSAPRARALTVLLASSEEACELHAKFCADRDRLKLLPRVQPPADLRARILAAVPAPKSIIEPRREPNPKARPWVPLAVAASVMLCLAASSFWFFLREGSHSGTASNARPTKEHANGAGRSKYAHVLPPENGPPPSAPVAIEDSPNSVAHDHPLSPEPRRVDAIPLPRPVTNLNAAPLLPDAPSFDLVRVRLPFLVSVSDLDRDDVQQKLVAELGRDAASRIDLFAKDAGRGGDAFLAAAKSAGVTVFSDAAATERMKRRLPGSFVVYSDALTAVEVRDLFLKVAAEDAKTTQRTFESLHVVAATAVDQKELKDVLGFDPGPWKKHSAPPADAKSVSASTADAVARAVGTSGPKAEKPAVMTTFGPSASRTPPVASKELKLYGEKRGERKSNSAPVMIVIRVPG